MDGHSPKLSSDCHLKSCTCREYYLRECCGRCCCCSPRGGPSGQICPESCADIPARTGAGDAHISAAGLLGRHYPLPYSLHHHPLHHHPRHPSPPALWATCPVSTATAVPVPSLPRRRRCCHSGSCHASCHYATAAPPPTVTALASAFTSTTATTRVTPAAATTCTAAARRWDAAVPAGAGQCSDCAAACRRLSSHLPGRTAAAAASLTPATTGIPCADGVVVPLRARWHHLQYRPRTRRPRPSPYRHPRSSIARRHPAITASLATRCPPIHLRQLAGQSTC